MSHRIEYAQPIFQWLRSRRWRSFESASASCRVRAVWALNGRSRIDSFDDDNRPAEPYGYALVSTDAGLGCCYADDFLEAPPDWVGQDVRTLSPERRVWEVALVDALPNADAVAPSRELQLDGPAAVKARWRADLLKDVALSTASRTGAEGPIVVFGAVGAFLESLSQTGRTLFAADLHPAVIGQSWSGITVRSFDEIRPVVRPGSLLVLTGMSISNDTIDEVFALSREHNAPLIVYAQSGASFASDYINLGAECVVAERFPFYTMPGLSKISVYERSSPFKAAAFGVQERA
jgi:hypothetical protein